MSIKKILVSQPRPTSEKSPYFDLEKKYGVEIVFRPFIKVEGLSSKEMIGRLSAEFYFVSGNGFSADAGLSGDNFFELELKRLCADRAKKIVALIDSTKLGTDSASSFIPADRIRAGVAIFTTIHERVLHPLSVRKLFFPQKKPTPINMNITAIC